METKKNNLLNAKHLFQMFSTYFLEIQQRAKKCTKQQVILDQLRKLPKKYPNGNRWTKEDTKEYAPVNKEIVSVLTKELSAEDIQNDIEWITKSTFLVTSNLDRTVINTCMAKLLSAQQKTILIKWKKDIRDEIHPALSTLIYNEKIHPELFGYFYKNAPGIILDNSNGNIQLGVANGTKCWYHSLAWNNTQENTLAQQQIDDAINARKQIVELNRPPDFINVQLADRNGKKLLPKDWKSPINLDSTNESVVIPIGLTISNASHYSTKIGQENQSAMSIQYKQHAVDLALSMTIWKSQGSTFHRVVVALEGSNKAPPWQFEHLYVAISRIRTFSNIRCFPLSPLYDKKKLFRLRPHIFTAKWIMDKKKLISLKLILR